MKSGRLFLFKTETLNITNLFQFCLYQSADNLYKPCNPQITDWYLSVNPSEFVCGEVKDVNDFRHLDWSDRVDVISSILATGQDLGIGNFDLGKLQFIKTQFPEATIVSYNYNTEMYELMLKHYVLTHLYRQSTGEVCISDFDQHLRDSGEDLLLYYTKAFDDQQLVPRYLPAVGDYSIPVVDFFNFEKFSAHFKNVDVALSPAAVNYYNSWRLMWAHTYGDMK